MLLNVVPKAGRYGTSSPASPNLAGGVVRFDAEPLWSRQGLTGEASPASLERAESDRYRTARYSGRSRLVTWPLCTNFAGGGCVHRPTVRTIACEAMNVGSNLTGRPAASTT